MAIEQMIIQRRYIDACFERAVHLLPPQDSFGNPCDWSTHVQLRASMEIASGMANVHDKYGGLLTIENLSAEYVRLRDESPKQSKLIADLRYELEQTKRELGRTSGGKQ